MATIRCERTISMGHRLPSYKGICASLHGHNITVEVVINSPRFLDFKVVDGLLETLLFPLDHAMVLYEKDIALEAIKHIPGQRIVLLSDEPTTENLAAAIFIRLRDDLALAPQMPSETSLSYVVVRETAKYAAIVHRETLPEKPVTMRVWSRSPLSTSIIEGNTVVNSSFISRPYPSQPAPVSNDHPAIQDLVLQDIERRKAVGLERYGTLLQPHNGRDFLRDAYEEAMDLVMYLRGAMFERDSK